MFMNKLYAFYSVLLLFRLINRFFVFQRATNNKFIWKPPIFLTFSLIIQMHRNKSIATNPFEFSRHLKSCLKFVVAWSKIFYLNNDEISILISKKKQFFFFGKWLGKFRIKYITMTSNFTVSWNKANMTFY